MSFDFRPRRDDDDDDMPVHEDETQTGTDAGRRINRQRRDGMALDLTDLSSYGVRFALVLLLLGFVTAAVFLVFNSPLTSSNALPTPTLLASEGTLIVFPTFTPGPPPSPLPSATPIPVEGSSPVATPGTGAPVVAGATVVIANTENQGANLRQTASTTADIVVLLKEGSTLTVLDGPVEADGFGWWHVQVIEDPEQSGWVAAPFLQVAP